MNRHARRAAAARARRAKRPGYRHRLALAVARIGDRLRGEVVHGVVQHDEWCDIYRGHACNCVPDISLHPDGGGEVITVALDGTVRKVATS